MSDTDNATSALSIAHSIIGYRPSGRPADDFYPTPRETSKALLSCESFADGVWSSTCPHVWEPACGDGAISAVMEHAYGYRVVSTDLYDHGYGQTGIDFLQTTRLLAPNIVTNPPFKLATEFVRHAVIDLQCHKLALLVKLAFLEGVERSQLLEETHLTRVYVFRRRQSISRVDYTRGNRGMLAFAWLVWQRGYFGKPTIEWI